MDPVLGGAANLAVPCARTSTGVVVAPRLENLGAGLQQVGPLTRLNDLAARGHAAKQASATTAGTTDSDMHDLAL